MNSLVDANYTDSEEENEASPHSGEKNFQDRLAEDPEGTRSPNSVDSKNSNHGSARSTPSKALRLVSYELPEEVDDQGNVVNISAEEHPIAAASDSDKNVEPVEMDIDTEDDATSQQGDTAGIGDEQKETESENKEMTEGRQRKISTSATVEAWTEGVKLPPEPPGFCSPALQESINKLYNRKIEKGYDMNAVIQSKKAFRNPSIYEKLIQFCAIDEHGTNFPKELYDGHLFGPESYYDELAKVQKADMEKREKAAKERSAKSATNKGDKRPDDSAGGGLAKRRSKWDQVGPPSNQSQTLNASGQPIRPALVASTTISASAKAIPAFGNLKKH